MTICTSCNGWHAEGDESRCLGKTSRAMVENKREKRAYTEYERDWFEYQVMQSLWEEIAAEAYSPDQVERHNIPLNHITLDKDGRQAVQDFLRGRGIDKLLHFTRLENLLGISQHGLLPVADLNHRNLDFKGTDSRRLDRIPEGISFSLTVPNIAMLSTKLDMGDFCVLELNAQLLGELPFLAFPTNAANRAFRKMVNQELLKLIGAPALQRMFLNGETQPDPTNNGQRIKVDRELLGLRHDIPTDPQAEIMILESIPAEAIFKIHTAFPQSDESPSFTGLFAHFAPKQWHFECAEYFSLPWSDFHLRCLDPTTIVELAPGIEHEDNHG